MGPDTQLNAHWPHLVPIKPKTNLWIVLFKAGTHSSRYFHTTYPLKNTPNDVSLSFQMSKSMISICYEEILADPSLQWFFPEEEWRSIHELPFLSTLWFQIVSERLFTHLTSPSMWGKVKMEFITSNSQKISGEITHVAVLVTNGVGRGKSWHGDYLLSPQPGKGGAIGSALHLTPVRLSQTECSGGEDICQLTFPPTGTVVFGSLIWMWPLLQWAH